MADSSEQVTITCPDHHQTLTTGLWNFLQCEYDVDFDLKCACRQVSAHRLILELFLLPDKLADTVSGWQLTQQPDKSEIECLLQFLYMGRVTVPKSQLGMLLKFARQAEFRMLVDALESGPEVGEPKETFEVGEPEVKSEVGEPDADFELGESDENSEVDDLEDNFESPKRFLRKRKKSCASSKFRKAPPKRKKFCPKDNSEVDESEDSFEGLKGVKSKRKKSCASLKSRKVPPKRQPRKRRTAPKKIKPKRVPGTLIKKKLTASATGYQCLVCPRVFSYRASLKRHTRLMHKVEALKETVEELKKRVEILKDKVPGARRIRSKVAASKKNLPASTSLSTGVQHDDPKGDFESQATVTQATESQAPESQVIEQISPPIIDVNQNSTDQPVTRTVDSLKYPCSVCSIKFASESRLHYHVTVVHKVVDRPWKEKQEFKCDECEMVFGRKQHLTSHRRLHADVRPYPCHLCARTFHHGSHLKGHLLRYHGEMPYKCAVCSEAFETHPLLKVHMGTHPVSKPYKCNGCDLSFKSSSAVATHVKRVHTNIVGRTFHF